ncbi:hypothetical protein J437_LFUL013336 [Ladona fulva]|uniref:HTH psq-type domain-containing protein n=1 Tax=Ladona fulva TaxID=123851 RepID=A0A8K0KJN8_LADFU|nr:hypothetical protein J437_LFUL013336 [Ladona fulva]
MGKVVQQFYNVQVSMVRTYVRKTDRQKWDINAMELAVEAVLSSKMGFLKASKQFNVPKSKQEEELVSYLKTMESRLFGLTMKYLRSLAYELAEKNGLTYRFNKETCLAGQDWIKENTSGARAMGFNKVAVSKFNSLNNYVIDKHKLTADKIFNCDETALKGKRQVGAITSAER